MSQPAEFDHSDYPAIFRAADAASVSAQKNYLRLTRSVLALLVAGAASAASSGAIQCARPELAVASTVLLAASLLLTGCLRVAKFEEVWYGGRAVAESVKSMTWRYVMGADPYPIGLALAEAEKKFLSELEFVVKERKRLAFGFGGEVAEGPQITKRMREVRAVPVDRRKNIYVSERVSGQRHWYGIKAKFNRAHEYKYFIAVALCQLFALVAAIELVRSPESSIKLTGFFTSLASALIAWLQVRQYKELAQSYSVAELELGFVQERAKHVVTDGDLSSFVADAENAISREHTLWVARRDRT